MKTEEFRKLIEQRGYAVLEEELDSADGRCWRVSISTGDAEAGKRWVSNGLYGQPLANAYRNLGDFITECGINGADGKSINPDDIEYPTPPISLRQKQIGSHHS